MRETNAHHAPDENVNAGGSDSAAGAKRNGQKHQREQPRGRDEEKFVLPQWAFELARPVMTTLTRAIWRASFHGTENIPQRRNNAGGFIIAANHQTYIDPFWVALPVKRQMRFLAWSEAFDWKFVGRLMDILGAWSIQLEGGDPTAVRRSIRWLREGGVLVIFPEGGRGNADGSVVRFKTGAARMALEAGVPILPVTIRGAHRVWNKTQKYPNAAKIAFFYHPLQRLAQRAGEDVRQAARRETELLASTIGSAL